MPSPHLTPASGCDPSTGSAGYDTSAPTLISGLLSRRAFRHSITVPPVVVETHISWVVLTGPYAYKIKKPVRFSFLDFSSLERRRAACEEELRLNRRLAPSLYVDVVPIRSTPHGPEVDGPEGPIVEWAVRMKQFPPDDQIDRCIGQDRLDPAELEGFGTALSRFHEGLPAAATSSSWGAPEEVQKGVMENLQEALALARHAAERETLVELQRWLDGQFEALRPVMAQRKAQGRIREGHGDLHLANLVRWEGPIVAFDCIEFDPALRWGDVISDAAFLFMDLLRHHRVDFAYRFLNAYLAHGGDYTAVPVLGYYAVHRALVRAKVHMISGSAGATGEHQRAVEAHLAVAMQLARPPRPRLVVMHGFSGSGKTWLSQRLLAGLPAIRMRSDVERKRLHGLSAPARSGSRLHEGLYAAAESTRTYARLATLAESVLRGGQNAIVDGTFLKREQRDLMRRLAQDVGAGFVLVDCQASLPLLRKRIVDRTGGTDASEADLNVLADQIAGAEPLQDDERGTVLRVDTEVEGDVEALVQGVRALSGR